MLIIHDRLTVDRPHRTSEGYFAVRAKAGRAGVQNYLGREIDPEGKHFKAADSVGVYRPAAEVFDQASVHSFLMKPITDDHPTEAITADNWAKHAKGVTARAMRDGEFLAFDLVLMDKALIEAVESGKRELSLGYNCSLDIGDGVAPDGTPYRATQRTVRGNHLAVVAQARAGPMARIGDAKEPDPPKSIDEALRQTFVIMAENQNLTVEQLLAGMDQKKLEELAAEIASQFISGKAGEGIARHFGDARQLREHRLTFAHMGDRAPSLTSRFTAPHSPPSALAEVGNPSLPATYTADQSAELARLRDARNAAVENSHRRR